MFNIKAQISIDLFLFSCEIVFQCTVLLTSSLQSNLQENSIAHSCARSIISACSSVCLRMTVEVYTAEWKPLGLAITT